ncbi:MAG: Fur family transcriptional regulator [Candidatus Omnitrophota bacterium]
MNKEIERTFGSYLRQNGMRVTPERKTILREIFAIHRHFDTEEIFETLRRKKTGISHASVYRTMPILVKAGLVSRTAAAPGKAVYEHIYGHEHHDHMFCVECGKHIEFKNDNIERLQIEICRKYGFKPEYHNLEIVGLCKNCAKGKRQGRKK